MVVAVLRLSTPSVASFARSDRWSLRIGDAAGRLKAEQEVLANQGGRDSLALRDDSSSCIDEHVSRAHRHAHLAGSAPCRQRPISFMNAGKRFNRA